MRNDNSGLYDKEAAKTMATLGDLFQNLKEYDKAQYFYKQSLESFSKLENEYSGQFNFDKCILIGRLSSLYSSLGRNYIETGDYKLFESYTLKSIELMKSENDSGNYSSIAVSYSLLASILKNLQYKNESLKYIEAGFKIEPGKYREQYMRYFYDMALLYKENNKDSFIYYSEKCIKHLEILEKNSPENFKLDFLLINDVLIHFYRCYNDYERFDKYAGHSLRLYREMVRVNLDRYYLEMIELIENLIENSILLNDKTKKRNTRIC